jgi:hypothetical protein
MWRSSRTRQMFGGDKTKSCEIFLVGKRVQLKPRLSTEVTGNFHLPNVSGSCYKTI